MSGRIWHRALTVAMAVAVLAGVAGGGYALARAFGVHSGPRAAGTAASRSHHTGRSVSRLVSHASAAPVRSASSASPIPMCSDRSSTVRVASSQGAAGTISTLWRVTNTSQSACRSDGYPGMDVRAGGRWLNVQVHRGGYPNIDEPPAPVVVPSGHSLYFVSYWGDVVTTAGPCKQFDRVKVTLPNNYVSAEFASSGCLTPTSVRVGPVSMTPPA